MKLQKYSKKLLLFPTRTPLEFVTIDEISEFIRTRRVNGNLLVIFDRFSQLARVVPLKRFSAITVAQAFVIHSIFA